MFCRHQTIASVFLCLSLLAGCNLQPAKDQSRPVEITKNGAPQQDPVPVLIVEPIKPVEISQPKPKKIDPPQNDDKEPWPVIVDDEPSEAKEIDPKIVSAWEKAGATSGWSNRHQFWEKRPDYAKQPEYLPYLSFRPSRPGVIATLPAPDQLFTLHQFGSDMKGENFGDFAGLKNLRTLNLNANYEFTGIGFKKLADLPELRVLSVYQTKVGDAGLKEICKIKSLQELSIGVSLVTEEGLPELVRLKRLQTLELRGIKIGDQGVKTLGGCLNLRDLTIGGPDYRPFGPTELTPLANLKKLQKLNIAWAKVTDANIKGLRLLTELRSLNLSRNPELGDAVLDEIGMLKELRTLDLSGTRVTDAGIKHLAGLENMEHLNLSVASITDAELTHLAKLKNLEVLMLYGTKVSQTGLKTLIGFESTKLRAVHLPQSIPLSALKEAQKLRPKTTFLY